MIKIVLKYVHNYWIFGTMDFQKNRIMEIPQFMEIQSMEFCYFWTALISVLLFELQNWITVMEFHNEICFFLCIIGIHLC